MNIGVEIGQKVLLDLGIESFVGDVYSIDPNRTRIRLNNVEDFQTKTKYNGVQNYFLSEVKSIIPLPDQSIQINKSTSDLPVQKKFNSDISINKNINENPKKIFSKQEWDSINFSLDNIQVIHQNDALYFNSIKDLYNQQHFVILMEDCEFGRNNISTVITIFAPQTRLTYVFDMIFIQKMHTELMHILGSDKHKKIMFNSNMLCDHLKFVQNVEKIDGIFDVLVAYLVTFKKEKTLDLISCIHKCFSLPENYFNTEVKYNWRKRPLLKSHIKFTAKKAIFLYKLYEYFLHDHLLKKFYQTCQTFSSTFCKNNDLVEVAHLMSNNDETAEKLAQKTDVELSISLNRLNFD